MRESHGSFVYVRLIFLLFFDGKGTMPGHRPWDERGDPGFQFGIPFITGSHDPVIFEDRADCRMAYAVTFSGTARGSDDREVATR